jgi:cell wall-associated NlpC family hydrolase
VHIARTTYQWSQDGPVVPLSQIQPGDLLFSAGSDVQIDPVDLASVVVATRPAGLAAKQ